MAATGETDTSMVESAGESSNSDVGGEKTILLISSENEQFEVPESAARLSRLVTHMIEDDCANGGIRLPNVTAEILVKVVDYCNKHAAVNSDADANDLSTQMELKKFDKEFLDQMKDDEMLMNLILAANFMDIKCLFNMACQWVADMMTGMSKEQIIKRFGRFGIENDLTPEEEEAVREEVAWA
uniref:SKP1-like protein n=1 Tax=Leersia perrieri TaxID=77586 RepID=A0A0D9XBV8_9ORYZ